MTQIRDLATHPDPYVSVTELAEYWHVSASVVYYWIAKEKILQAERIGGSWRVKTSVALAFGRPYEPVLGPVAS